MKKSLLIFSLLSLLSISSFAVTVQVNSNNVEIYVIDGPMSLDKIGISYIDENNLVQKHKVLINGTGHTMSTMENNYLSLLEHIKELAVEVNRKIEIDLSSVKISRILRVSENSND